jgi:hypothetical protein
MIYLNSLSFAKDIASFKSLNPTLLFFDNQINSLKIRTPNLIFLSLTKAITASYLSSVLCAQIKKSHDKIEGLDNEIFIVSILCFKKKT